MRTWLRGKVTLLFMTCAVILLVFPAMASAQGAPTIQSDKADYAPGELVTLTGSGWQAGESVHINVNDTYGATWSRNVDVTADASGNITDSFNLPNSFVSDYDVTATGAQSGTVRTTFTDSVPQSVAVSPTSQTVTQGDNPTYTVNVDMAGNMQLCTVTLSAVGLPSGTTASFTDNPHTGGPTDYTSTLTVDTTNTTPTGTHTISVNATKPAGCNGGLQTVSSNQVTLVVNSADSTGPVITPNIAGTLGDNGWYTSDVNLTWSVVDDESDISSQSGCDDVSVTSDQNAVEYTCTATSAGGTNSQSVTIKRDATAPTINGTRTPAANANGWNNTDVTVSYTCSDSSTPGSGLASGACPASDTVTTEGANQSRSGTVTDQAGNTASTTVGNINIDKTNPLVSLVGGPADGSSHYFGFVPNAPTCTASDALSGLDGACSVSGYGTTVGDHTVKAEAKDKAANTNSASNSYTVLGWTLDGFKSPVDMGIPNDAKGGSTVPLKFEVFAGPTELTSTSVVDYFTQKISCASGQGDAIEQYTTGNTELRYDTTSGQFIFNWKTPKAPGSCYRVTLQTDDGSKIYADFRLK